MEYTKQQQEDYQTYKINRNDLNRRLMLSTIGTRFKDINSDKFHRGKCFLGGVGIMFAHKFQKFGVNINTGY